MRLALQQVLFFFFFFNRQLNKVSITSKLPGAKLDTVVSGPVTSACSDSSYWLRRVALPGSTSSRLRKNKDKECSSPFTSSISVLCVCVFVSTPLPPLALPCCWLQTATLPQLSVCSVLFLATGSKRLIVTDGSTWIHFRAVTNTDACARSRHRRALDGATAHRYWFLTSSSTVLYTLFTTDRKQFMLFFFFP